MLLGIIKQCWHIFLINQKTLLGGAIPIAILVAILGCFSLFYTNTLEVINFLFKVKNYSLILKSGTPKAEIDRMLELLNNNPQVSELKTVLPEQTQKDILKDFDLINKKLKAFKLNQFPFVIEFSLLGSEQQAKKFTDLLKSQPQTYALASGIEASSQVKNLFKAVNIVGNFFLVLLAISVFYIINHSTQVSFLKLIKEVEILGILGAPNSFIYIPFVFIGFLLSVVGFLLGILIVYVMFLLGVALITFDDSSFFVRQVATFFSLNFLLKSLFSIILISFISSWVAIYNVFRKISL